jgi:diadenosine tetraphosphatase ApaH/serine/threonine PP2A family protein phosphatase
VPDVIDRGRFDRVALLGGIYSNHLALREALALARGAGSQAIVALGDLGAFGPHPDRSIEILREAAIPVVMGNYEEALSSGADDCHCGYTDPRDNHFARISYEYTRSRTSAEHIAWMATLPRSIRLTVGEHRVLLCHGSPRRINEFLWASTTPEPFIRRLLREHDADIIACTHTGLHWSRFVQPGRGVVNVGAIGRPANDGRTNVWFCMLEAAAGAIEARFVPVVYDHEALAREMLEESLPAEFVETIRTGWWTCCLEILPARERGAGKL